MMGYVICSSLLHWRKCKPQDTGGTLGGTLGTLHLVKCQCISFSSFSPFYFLDFTVPVHARRPSGSPEAHHMTSTKNSLGFPMAMRKDWREAVSSGGTEDRSRSGGEPGAAVTGVCGCGGRPGGPHTRLWAWEWVLRMVCELRTLCSLGGTAERSLGAFSLFSDSLPLPDLPPDSCVPAAAFASFLLPLRFEPLLRLPASEMKERKNETFCLKYVFHITEFALWSDEGGRVECRVRIRSISTPEVISYGKYICIFYVKYLNSNNSINQSTSL